MSERLQQEAIALKYKAISLLFAGPRYYEKLPDVISKIDDKGFVDSVNGIIEVYKMENSDKLRTQYTSCFVNNYPSLPCPPYESWYLNRTVHGRAVAKLNVWYRKYDLYPLPLPEDHVSAIAEFAAYLYHTGKDDADKFVKEHVLTWMGKLAEDIINKCEEEYVKMLGLLLREFLSGEEKRLRTV